MILLLSLLNSTSAFAASSKNPEGAYVSFRGGAGHGSLLYQNASYNTYGNFGQIELGLRPWNFLKIGVMGIYEAMDVNASTGNLGIMSTIGYGAAARLFFVPRIYIEAGGGQTQANFQETLSRCQIVTNASFYYLGSGIEWNFGTDFSIELGIRQRTITFEKNEFQNVKSLFYSGGLNIYF